MDEKSSGSPQSPEMDLRNVIRNVVEEFVSAERRSAEPAYKTELADERKRRETLERRVNELAQENERSRKLAEETDRHAAIRSELQKLGVQKVDLAFRIVKDDIQRAGDGALLAKSQAGELPMQDYLTQFVKENPEFLPARISGGSGAMTPDRVGAGGGIDLEKIRPGMSPEELQRVREQITQVAYQSLRGE